MIITDKILAFILEKFIIYKNISRRCNIMKGIWKILLSLLGITIIGFSICSVGGITIFGIDITHEAPKPPTSKEKRDNADLEAKRNGDNAIEEGKYLDAIGYYESIHDNSDIVEDKEQLIESAKDQYLSYIISEANNEVENNNYNRAKNLIKDGLKKFPESEILLDKQKYVSACEELYSLTETNDSKDVITYINSNEDVFGNDKTVSEIYSQAKNSYLSDVVSDSNQKIESHEYDSARKIINSAKKLIGKDKKIAEQSRNIDEKEVSYKISVYRDKEDWYGMYKYINSLKETLKNDNLSTLKDAKSKMINTAISDSDEYLNDRKYDSAKKVLSDLKKKIGNDDEIDEQSKKIDKTIVSDKISDLKEEESWREIIDYINDSSYKKEFKTDYSNAYSKYKSEILEEARNYLENDEEEGVTYAYDTLLTAEDILSGDDDYKKLCEEIENQNLSNSENSF